MSDEEKASLDEVLGARSEIKLSDGKTYEISELNIGDFADFERYAKRKLREDRKEQLIMAKEVYGDQGIPAEVAKAVFAQPTKPEIEAEQETIEGTSFLLWCAMREKNPEMTRDRVQQLVSMEMINDILVEIGAKDEDAPEPETTDPKNVPGPEVMGGQ